MRVPFREMKASVLLDLLRGMAALLVCVGHWRNIFFVDFGQVQAHRGLLALLYAATSGGHQAVMLFFVLSGYLVGGSVTRAMRTGTWDWRRYATHRMVRLWVVLVPGLLLCALWDGVGLRSGLAPLLYHGASGNHVVLDVSSARGGAVLLGNLMFVQEILVRTFGSDGPLWSLAYEFWYYVLFPLGLIATVPGTGVARRVLCVLGFAATAWFVGGTMLVYFPVWLAGALLALAPRLNAGAMVRTLAALGYVPFLLAMAKWSVLFDSGNRGMGLVADYAVMGGSVGLLWVMLSATEPAGNRRWERWSRGAARFSFTLYVSHVPLLVLLMAVLGGDRRWVPDVRHLMMGGGALVTVLAYCWGLAWLTEFRTGWVRRWLELRWGINADREGRT